MTQPTTSTIFQQSTQYLADHSSSSIHDKFIQHLIGKCTREYQTHDEIGSLMELYSIASQSFLIRGYEGEIVDDDGRVYRARRRIHQCVMRMRSVFDKSFKAHKFVDLIRLDIKTRLLQIVPDDKKIKVAALTTTFKYRFDDFHGLHEYY